MAENDEYMQFVIASEMYAFMCPIFYIIDPEAVQMAEKPLADCRSLHYKL